MKVLAQIVKTARESAKLSQEELAKLIDMSPANYNKYETGKRTFTVAVLERIKKHLDVPVDLSDPEIIEILGRYDCKAVSKAYNLIGHDAALEDVKAEKERQKEK